MLIKRKIISSRLSALIESLRYSWPAVWAACWTYWKVTATSLWSFSYFISALPIAGVWAWVAIQNPDPSVLSYMIVSAPMMAIWRTVYYGIINSLRLDMYGGTIEFNMLSRTSIQMVVFGRTLAMMLFGIPAGILAVIIMLLVARQSPQIASYSWLIPSVILTLFGLTMIGLALAPISALMNRNHPGMFSPLIAFIATLCGFAAPIDVLPQGLAVLAHCLPSTWAMESAMQAVRGTGSTWSMVSGWLYCLVLSAVFLFFSYFLFKMVEKRLRVTGIVN